MKSVSERLYTVEEYFAFCEQNTGRFEYVNGKIIEIGKKRSLQSTNFQIISNIKEHFGHLINPDFFFFHESVNQKKQATEPIFIVEVLSESSINTDRVTKLAEYTQIPTLQYYLIIEQEECLVEVFNREGKRWYVDFYSDLKETIDLPALDVKLPLSVIYKKINLPAASSPSE
ncbi:Uma2 family endonuclease [Runella sp.]|jgi:Uma2 family endonuclease|uniref:Uma2 family endonuclease n=1 Tax=Runella sp. TaxID=1960881 RepID=UPI002606E600|nr:Uma2 family endonuclease [Runella sp.]